MGVTALMPAVGGTSVVCYLLMTRAQNQAARRPSSDGGSSASYGSYVSGGDASGIFGWFGGDHSASGNSDVSCGDSGGGGGDCGGGGD